MLQQAIIIASIKDLRSGRWIFQGLEVSYAVHVDPEASEEVLHQQVLLPFSENLKRLLKTLPRGQRVNNNPKHYVIQIEDMQTVASH